MSYHHDLRRLRRARQHLKRQRHELLALELDGIVMFTLHSVARSLTLALQPETRSDLVDLLLKSLSQRRDVLKDEAAQTRENWQQELDRQQQLPALDEPSTPALAP